MSTGTKAGLGVGIPVAVGLLGLVGYFMYKYSGKMPKLPNLKIPDLQNGNYGNQPGSWDPQSGNGAEKFLGNVPPSQPGKPGPDDTTHSIHTVSSLSDTTNAAIPPVPPATNPSDSRQKLRLRKLKANGELHHHHVTIEHPCYTPSCSQVQPEHHCTDSRCLCADPTAPMENHKCEDIKFPCACTDEQCPLNNGKHECPNPDHPCICLDETCPLSIEQKEKRRNDTAFGFGIKAINIGGTHLLNSV